MPTIVGPIQCKFNYQFALTVTEFTYRKARQVTQKFGAQGPIGTAIGQVKINGSAIFAVPRTGMEFDFDAALDSPDGFAFSFTKGSQKFVAKFCYWDGQDIRSVMETGDSAVTVNFSGTLEVRTA